MGDRRLPPIFKKHMKTVYVLHAYGANSHYNGLLALCQQEGIKLVFREFRVYYLTKQALKNKNYTQFFRQFTNLLFLLNLLLTKGKTIVVGIHPYDNRLPIISFILKKHKVYHHTSCTMWNPQDPVYETISEKKFERLKRFMHHQVKHVFAVTEKTKQGILDYIGLEESKINVVYHSYFARLTKSSTADPYTYIYVGRLEHCKGIHEICEYFIAHSELTLILIGDGECRDYVETCVSRNSNILYYGYINGILNLMPYYNRATFFVLNSKRTAEWEELFGQVLIESMSCGCIPVSVNHSGPKEVISDGQEGILFCEGDLHKALDKTLELDETSIAKMSSAAYDKGHNFESNIIATKWRNILIL